MKYSGYDHLAEEKHKLYVVENALCSKLRGVLKLSNSTVSDFGSLQSLLNKKIPQLHVHSKVSSQISY